MSGEAASRAAWTCPDSSTIRPGRHRSGQARSASRWWSCCSRAGRWWCRGWSRSGRCACGLVPGQRGGSCRRRRIVRARVPERAHANGVATEYTLNKRQVPRRAPQRLDLRTRKIMNTSKYWDTPKTPRSTLRVGLSYGLIAVLGTARHAAERREIRHHPAGRARPRRRSPPRRRDRGALAHDKIACVMRPLEELKGSAEDIRGPGAKAGRPPSGVPAAEPLVFAGSWIGSWCSNRWKGGTGGPNVDRSQWTWPVFSVPTETTKQLGGRSDAVENSRSEDRGRGCATSIRASPDGNDASALQLGDRSHEQA